MKADVVVLGAGMVGISAAIALQKRGRSVVLLDRRGPAEEASYGNAGIIQREAIEPYLFPREWNKILKYAFNRLPEAHLHWRALPSIGPWLYRYWRNSTAETKKRGAAGMLPIISRSVAEHEELMAASGMMGLMRRTGYMRIYRTAGELDKARADSRLQLELYGVPFEELDEAGVRAKEPHLQMNIAGGIFLPQPVSVSDPGALGQGYASYFQSLGGHLLEGDAGTLEGAAEGWRVTTASGVVEARDAVVALGHASARLLAKFGYRVPLGVKRGYHKHFHMRGNSGISRPIVDSERGYAMAPMTKGLRITTGAEFADAEAPPTPIQLEKVVPFARELFPLDGPAEVEPWLGRRPCLPDMLPVIGKAPRHKGLWLDFGHQHLGFTLGPVSGRLLADMMTGEPPFTDPAPYRVERFL
jgi:D-amino-acid dehydrogenase